MSFVLFFKFAILTCIFALFSEISLLMPSEAGDGRSSINPPVVGNSFVFKIEDQKGRMHRFACGRCYKLVEC